MHGNQASAHLIVTNRWVIVYTDCDPQTGISPTAVTAAGRLTSAGLAYTSTVLSAACARQRCAAGYFGARTMLDDEAQVPVEQARPLATV